MKARDFYRLFRVLLTIVVTLGSLMFGSIGGAAGGASEEE